ncbi:hypothetical protein [Polluticoccus soli]|uniref:hypothetical protein n=1 Tax=Polluticoccus soli TaxID=3034150 RepID=UPI0023E31149|nr:hypothetical protein [Flavipsychrobacter sp. JY13-12]
MKDLLNKMTEKVAETRDAAVEAFESNLNFAKFSEKFTGMSDSAKEKSINFMNDLISLSPIIDEIGFATTGITVSLGLPPDVTFHFQKATDIPTEKRDAILEQHKDKAMLSTIVKTLLLADSYQQKLKLGSFHFTNIDVCIGLTGGVSFQLVPKDK